MPLLVNAGDVLLFSRPVNKAVLFGQKLISVGRDLHADYVHAGLVVQGGGISGWALHSVELAHAIVSGIQREQLRVSPPSGWGRVDIWRVPDRLAIAAQSAAQVAMRWSQFNAPKMSFSTRKAFMAGFGSSSFGSEAQRRVDEYQEYRDRPGGPPSLHDPAVSKSVFCSMFVVAVFQAVLGTRVASEMDADARNVSPMKLHSLLNQKGWFRVGAAFDIGTGVQVVRHNGDLVSA